MFRGELFHLEVDHYKTPEFEMIEEEIDVIITTLNLKQELSTDKRESHPQLKKKFLDMIHQALFQILFSCR
jgi:hypothetical protein